VLDVTQVGIYIKFDLFYEVSNATDWEVELNEIVNNIFEIFVNYNVDFKKEVL